VSIKRALWLFVLAVQEVIPAWIDELLTSSARISPTVHRPYMSYTTCSKLLAIFLDIFEEGTGPTHLAALSTADAIATAVFGHREKGRKRASDLLGRMKKEPFIRSLTGFLHCG